MQEDVIQLPVEKSTEYDFSSSLLVFNPDSQAGLHLLWMQPYTTFKCRIKQFSPVIQVVSSVPFFPWVEGLLCNLDGPQT